MLLPVTSCACEVRNRNAKVVRVRRRAGRERRRESLTVREEPDAESGISILRHEHSATLCVEWRAESWRARWRSDGAALVGVLVRSVDVAVLRDHTARIRRCYARGLNNAAGRGVQRRETLRVKRVAILNNVDLAALWPRPCAESPEGRPRAAGLREVLEINRPERARPVGFRALEPD